MTRTKELDHAAIVELLRERCTREWRRQGGLVAVKEQARQEPRAEWRARFPEPVVLQEIPNWLPSQFLTLLRPHLTNRIEVESQVLQQHLPNARKVEGLPSTPSRPKPERRLRMRWNQVHRYVQLLKRYLIKANKRIGKCSPASSSACRSEIRLFDENWSAVVDGLIKRLGMWSSPGDGPSYSRRLPWHVNSLCRRSDRARLEFNVAGPIRP